MVKELTHLEMLYSRVIMILSSKMALNRPKYMSVDIEKR